jgi:hypothetical protein
MFLNPCVQAVTIPDIGGEREVKTAIIYRPFPVALSCSGLFIKVANFSIRVKKKSGPNRAPTRPAQRNIAAPPEFHPATEVEE